MMSHPVRSLILSGFALLLLSTNVQAQTSMTAPAAADTSAQPLEISADNALEWDRVNKKYTARGNAVAIQKDMEVKADLLVAEYRETKEKSSEIYKLTATGNVVLTSAGLIKPW